MSNFYSHCIRLFFLFIISYSFASCSSRSVLSHPNTLSSIQIIDRNGLSEMITTKERLQQFQKTNFLSSLPYKQVTRRYGKDLEGNFKGYITSYHPNGQPHQYLETLNSRAQGVYREWHTNSKLKIDSLIIGGIADLTSAAHKSWLFEGMSEAYDEYGNISAIIQYSKGELEGLSTYYHSNGKVWKRIPYHQNEINGTMETRQSNGFILQKNHYLSGELDGPSQRFWDEDHLAFEESYKDGYLESGKYFDQAGNLLSEVINGTGERLIFGKYAAVEYHSYINGKQEGSIRTFDEQGKYLLKTYHVKNNMKNGEEITYFYHSLQAKISINWYNDSIQGTVKTWHSNGQLESQREINQNKKHGLSTAWYLDGSLMLIEEYDHDLLVKGEYFRKGESSIVSRVINGEGTSTLFDSHGQFLKSIVYKNGKPSK